MERIDGKSLVPELTGKLMAGNLLGDENNDLGVLFTAKVNGSSTTRGSTGSTGFLVALFLALVNKLAQYFLELVLLLILPHHVDMLLDILIGDQGIDLTDIDLDGILQEVMGESLNLLGPSGREEKGLSLFRDPCHNGTDLRLEAHVQHSVGLIKDKKLDPGQIGFPHLEQIVKPARRGDDDLNTTLKGGNLGELVASTVAAHGPGTTGTAKALRLLHNLARELAGWSQYKKDGPILGHITGTLILGPATSLDELMQRGQKEATRFATACFSDADHVRSLDGNGPGLTLNGSGSGETGSLETALDGISKGSIGKLQEGIGKFLRGGIGSVTTDSNAVQLFPFGRRLGCLFLLLLLFCFALLLPVLGQVHGTGTPPLIVRSIFGTATRSSCDLIKVLGVGPHPLHLITVTLSSLDQLLGLVLKPLGLSLPLLLAAFVQLLLGLELLVRDAQRFGLGLQLGLPLVAFFDVGNGCHGGLLCKVGNYVRWILQLVVRY
mmetsp:Transcript_11400/g.32278  ORF Transcript_11400/g.32278 Transcript_11400/m.32278 type:complete len:494 (+) Transcript_11400:2768-4249(+)